MIEFTRLETASPKTYDELVAWHLKYLDLYYDDTTRGVVFSFNQPTLAGIHQFLETKKISIKPIGTPSIGYGYSINNNNPSFIFKYSTPESSVIEAIYAVFEELGKNPNAFF